MKLCTEHGYKTQRITVADDIESPESVKDSYETMLKDAAKRQRKLDRDLLKAVKNQRVSSSNKVLEEEN